jgi:2-polyprenyl-3-methyl-5-hydroxy-6-metoxy-1,4-benzoquinol methylase
MKEEKEGARWEKAQKYEKEFWRRQAEKSVSQANDFEWYRKRGQEVFNQAASFLKNFETIHALEIGSGPIGIVGYMEAAKRYAIDPLEDYYRSNPALVKARDREVRYFCGTGEDVKTLNMSFHLVLIDNVLDHVKNPLKVLIETRRVMEPGGILFLSINLYTRWGGMVRRLMEVFEIDKGHPYNFTRQSMLSLLRKTGFEILRETAEEYEAQKRKYRQASDFKKRVKSYLGVTDYRFSAICRKTE